MIKFKLEYRIIVSTFLLCIGSLTFAQDPNFYIYLCFGQSNMEGSAKIEAQDKVEIDNRFMVMETIDCNNLQRQKGEWYTALPPLCRCHTGLTPADYFGRTMALNLPDSIKIGVINVSVAGCRIELFEKNNFQSYADSAPDWMAGIISEYDGNPYARLVEMAKLAQNDGVIKGILLHQGESNPNDTLWTQKVKAIYDNLISDLNLNPTEIPLLAGELLSTEYKGKCYAFNEYIAQLPGVIPNSYVVSSHGCPGREDGLHFTAEGYRILGKRYAYIMLSQM